MVGDYYVSTAGVSFVTGYSKARLHERRRWMLMRAQAVQNLQGVFDRDWASNYTFPLPPFTPNAASPFLSLHKL